MKKQLYGKELLSACIVILLIMAACSLPGVAGTTPQPPPAPTETLPAETAPTEAISAPTDTPAPEVTAAAGVNLPPPAAGTSMLWVDSSVVVFVPGGEFSMGDDSAIGSDNGPVHKVIVDSFWIHQAEVTNQQYALCVTAGICNAPEKSPYYTYWFADPIYTEAPIYGVDWNQADAYCKWINGRLPTEAEWEKAARGTEAQPYPWGIAEPVCNLLNFNECLDPAEPAFIRSYASGASPFNALDMAGNVYEWVNDWYAKDYYAASPASNPPGPDTGELKIYRGGSFNSLPEDVRTFLRFSVEPEYTAPDLGFRCVLDGDVTPPPPTCAVPGYTPPEGDGSAPETPSASVKAYCSGVGNSTQTSIDVKFSTAPNLDATSVTANGATLNCIPYKGDPTKIACFGAPLAQGKTVEVKVCQKPAPVIPAGEPTCPAGYTYDPDTKFCQLDSGKLPSAPCPAGYLEVPGAGCFPTGGNGCGEGSFQIILGSTSLCVPQDACLFGTPPEDLTCAPQCLEGYTYNAEAGCCTPPGNAVVCPLGQEYYAPRGICIKRTVTQNPCQTFKVSIPACPTPTSPPPAQRSCSIYKDEKSCESNNCVWHNTQVAAPYCADK